MTTTARVQMLDISGHGATIAGHEVAGVDLRLVSEWADCGVKERDEIAEAVNQLASSALDGQDGGLPADFLYWARAQFLRPTGVATVDIHFEQSTNGMGWVCYIPEETTHA